MSPGKSPPRKVKVVLLIGTVKGVFLYETNERRSAWKLSGPYLGGWEIFSLCGDPRRGRILAGTGSFEHGPTIRISEDGGRTWKGVKRDPKFTKAAKGAKAGTGAKGTKGAKAKEAGRGEVAGTAAVEAELKHIWQIVPGHPSEPGTWYAGVDDAALFVSRDDGDTWSEMKGLSNHPTRARWMPGFGGLCLHSIVVDPTNAKRLWVAISAVGVFRSDDAGATWKVCNQGLYYVASDFVLEDELGRCVHKLLLDPTRPGSLALQFHGGVFTSDDAGDSWKRISAGLPHEFGFPMVATPRGDFFVVPLLADTNRVVPDGALKVWRTRDRGRTWRALTKGLPQKEHFVGVLRDAMTADTLEPAGLYMGTTGGELFYSKNNGDNWEKLPANFPRITTVKVWER